MATIRVCDECGEQIPEDGSEQAVVPQLGVWTAGGFLAVATGEVCYRAKCLASWLSRAKDEHPETPVLRQPDTSANEPPPDLAEALQPDPPEDLDDGRADPIEDREADAAPGTVDEPMP